MPELPEVETIRRQLEKQIVGCRIDAVQLLVPKIAGESGLEASRGRLVEKLDRHGKYLKIRLSAGLEIITHLRMTGRLLLRQAGEEPDPYLCAVFHLAKRTTKLELRFCDMWRWGEMRLVPSGDYRTITGLQTLGPDAVNHPWTGEELKTRAARRKLAVKAFLLDQKVIAGLGNIYADEILFSAGVRPTSPCGKVSLIRHNRICEQMHRILMEAIGMGGTTLRDYRDAAGRFGGYIPQVYGRQDSPCLKCGHIIKRVIVGGRGTAFCPVCQTK